MKAISPRAKALACTFLATAAAVLAAPAHAQFVAPPNLPQQDANGVDLRRGTLSESAEDISVGAGAFPQRLTLVRTYSSDANFVGAFGIGSSHNFDMRVYRYTSGTQVKVDVVRGGETEEFTQTSPGVYTTTETSGATLSGTFSGSSESLTYTMADGSTISFTPTDANICNSNGDKCGVATSWKFPSGAQITFQYGTLPYFKGTGFNITTTDVTALQSVTNNFGYRFAFLPQKVTGLAVPATFRVSAVNLAQGSSAIAFVQYGYDATSHMLATITDTQSNITTLTYSGTSLTGITPPTASAPAKSIAYASGLVSTVTRAGIGTWTYSVGASQTTVTDPGGNVTTSYYGSDPVPQWTKDGLNRQTSYTWDSDNRLLTASYPEGNSLQLWRDARGNVTQTVAHAKPGSGAADIVTSAAYPASCTNVVTCNLPTSTTDARGNTTDYTYDGTTGQLLTVTAPAPTAGATRPQVRYGYTSLQAWYDTGSGVAASGLPVSMPTSVSACQTGASCAGTSDEVKTTIAYSGGGAGNNLNPASVTSGSGDGALAATTAATWDAVGNLLTVDGPLAGTDDTTRYRWDSERRAVGAVSPDPDGAGAMKMRAVRNSYDVQGRLTAVDRGTVASQSDADWSAMTVLDTRAVAYDSGNRKAQETLAAAGTTYALTQYSYDSSGRLQCTAQRMNPAAYGSLPADACTLGTAGSYGNDRIVKTSYDAADEATTTTSAYGTAEQSDDVTTAYTSNGKVASVTDAEGNKTSYVYDGQDRLSQTQYPSGTKGAGTSNSSDYEQLGYDAGGNVTSRRLRDASSIGYTYDALGRLTFKDLPGSDPDVTYTYDLLGRMTGAAQTGTSLGFGYDALGRKVSETNAFGTYSSAYDLAGRRTRLTHPDGFYVDQDYLVTGEMVHIRENGASSGVGVLATYVYDDFGRRTSVTYGDGSTTSYSYDGASRLTQQVLDLAGTASDLTLGFTYNPAGQIVTNTRSNDTYAWNGHYNVNRGYTANGLNQYSAVASLTPAYDARGNLTSDGTTTMGYDSENRMTLAPSGIHAFYDPLGRMSGVGTTAPAAYYESEGALNVAERTTTGAVGRRHVFGPGGDEPVVWYEGSGTSDRRFYHQDERGSTVALTDGSGNVLSTTVYDEYGAPRTTSSTYTARFLYTGQRYFSAFGLYYYKARMYSPTWGRFMQTDPIGYESGMNAYVYADGDPVNLLDPSGLCPSGTSANPIKGGSSTGGNDGTRIVVTAKIICRPDPVATFNNGGSGGGGGGGGASGGGGRAGGATIRPDDPIVVTGRRKRPFGVAITVTMIRADTMLGHFLDGSGENVCLTGAQFRDIAQHAKPTGPKIPFENGNYSQNVGFDNFNYRNTFGVATMYFNSSGRAIGFYDLYDMDPKPWGSRSTGAEVLTWIGHIGYSTGAKNFETGYPCQ